MKFDFWKDGFSLDESKQSMMMLLAFICTIFALVVYWRDSSIGNNLANIVQTCLYSIAGVTSVKLATGAYNNKNNDNNGDMGDM